MDTMRTIAIAAAAIAAAITLAAPAAADPDNDGGPIPRGDDPGLNSIRCGSQIIHVNVDAMRRDPVSNIVQRSMLRHFCDQIANQ
jgi:hypothetical protein